MDKMDNFNPLEFNLMEKDAFQIEKNQIFDVIRVRVQEMASKIRNLEKYASQINELKEEEEISKAIIEANSRVLS